MTRALLLAGAVWCLIGMAGFALGADIRVIDGDTLAVDGVVYRLHGIDAPEGNQPGGDNATRALEALVDLGDVRCQGTKRDRYGRLIVVCHVKDIDMNAAMVREGWALAYRRYSMDYVKAEFSACLNQRGMWAGEFVEPWRWRRGEREPKRYERCER